MHRLGRLDEAIKRYWQTNDEPNCAYNLGLALLQKQEWEESILALRHAFFSNIYITPLLVNLPVSAQEIWHGTNLAEPTYAREYVEENMVLWSRASKALDFLKRLWTDSTIKAELKEFLEIRRGLAKTDDVIGRTLLVTRSDQICSPSRLQSNNSEITARVIAAG